MNDCEKAFIQNLEDAGCDQQMIEMICQYAREGKCKEKMCLLKKHRNCLLNSIHAEQKKLDCLDYLIHKICKEEE